VWARSSYFKVIFAFSMPVISLNIHSGIISYSNAFCEGEREKRRGKRERIFTYRDICRLASL